MKFALFFFADTDEDRYILTPKCSATYIPEKVMYNISVVWTVDDPIVLEVIEEFKISRSTVESGFRAIGRETKTSVLKQEVCTK